MASHPSSAVDQSATTPSTSQTTTSAPAPVVVRMNGETLHRVGTDSTLFLSLTVYNGESKIHVRNFIPPYKNVNQDNKDYVPTQKGICLSAAQWVDLLGKDGYVRQKLADLDSGKKKQEPRLALPRDLTPLTPGCEPLPMPKYEAPIELSAADLEAMKVIAEDDWKEEEEGTSATSAPTPATPLTPTTNPSASSDSEPTPTPTNPPTTLADLRRAPTVVGHENGNEQLTAGPSSLISAHTPALSTSPLVKRANKRGAVEEEEGIEGDDSAAVSSRKKSRKDNK